MRYIETAGGLTISAQGFGAMGMSAYYGSSDLQEAEATLRQAVDLGVTLIDTAEIYGPFRNEELVGRALRGRREEIVLATKFGRRITDDGRIGGPDGSPEYARTAVERSFQSGTSLFSQDVLHNGTEELLDELVIALVAFSPLGRGMLAGRLRTLDDLAPDDARRTLPRFQDGALQANLALAAAVREVAQSLELTAAQVSLAWLQDRGVVPLPGTRNRSRLLENVGAVGVCLPATATHRLAEAASKVMGARDTAAGLAFTTN